MPTTAEHRIDRYEILAELGRGATGVVYRARDPELDRLVTIKTLRPSRELPADERGALQRRLHEEAVAVARLNHPNIVAVHDVVVWHDAPCIVMEYVEGRTLAQLIAEGPLAPATAIHVVLQVCDALQYSHGLGVVHRDIKPGNILVSETGRAKLGDFSIGAETGALVGTPGYMAPEQVTDGAAGPRGDVFSLGVVLYEAVSGVRAFPGSDLASVLFDVAHVEPPSPRQYSAAVTPALVAVIGRAMSKRPDRRYESAQAFARALARARDSVTGGTRAGAFRAARPALALGLACLAIAGSTQGQPTVRRGPGPPAGHSGETGPVLEAPARPRPAEPSRLHRSVPVSAERAAPPAAIPAPERSGRRGGGPSAHDGGQPAARIERVAARTPGPAAPVERQGCLSVNAIPFATVLVDGQPLGETPAACLRLGVGEHRVQLEQDGERSPERVVRVSEQHTVENPVRLSYDFRSRQFHD